MVMRFAQYRPARSRKVCTLLALLLVALPAMARAKPKRAARAAAAVERTARSFAAARRNPLELRAWLLGMPKGADLHNHLSGAVYAESWIRAGAEDGLCVNLATLSFAKAQSPPAGETANLAGQPVCGEGNVSAARAFQDQHLYDALMDSFSMRSFVPSPGVSGHDHFFASFGKFAGTSPRHLGEWLDEVASRAAAQNEEYLELMETPDFRHTAALARELPWKDDFRELRSDLLARGLRDDVAVARAELDQAEGLRRRREHCGQPDAAPACEVELRFLYQVLRGFPKEQVFAQALLGFEVASADRRFVGINFVMPEDGYLAMSDYALQMRMVGFLHGLYPQVHISLHAGELAPGLVTPQGLCCHVRLAVEQAHAERIGHGVDVMYEDRPYDLLKEMAAKHIMIEINLTSNAVILSIKGKDHPFPIYRQFGVPVALATDDEGVSRIDITHEYVRAADAYDLSYRDLKKMARTALEHSFLAGKSLWRDQDMFTRPVAGCERDSLGTAKPSTACAAFLGSNEKAQQQWELERRFRVFEAGF